jgi:hypothetical protein
MTPPPGRTGVPGATTRSRRRRLLIVLPLVLAGAAVILRVVDAIPPWLRAEPRGLARYPTVEALERETRTQLLLPFYFPDLLAWPPQAVYRAAGDGRPTAVLFAERETGRTRLVVAQCLDGACTVPDRLLSPGREIGRSTTVVGGEPADVIRRAAQNGQSWTDISWVQHNRRVVLRMYGDDRELLRIARSMRRGHP